MYLKKAIYENVVCKSKIDKKSKKNMTICLSKMV